MSDGADDDLDDGQQQVEHSAYNRDALLNRVTLLQVGVLWIHVVRCVR